MYRIHSAFIGGLNETCDILCRDWDSREVGYPLYKIVSVYEMFAGYIKVNVQWPEKYAPVFGDITAIEWEAQSDSA